MSRAKSAASQLAAFQHALDSAKFVAVLTGAGVSAESGIPTFRDASTGALWRRYDPVMLATPRAFVRDPSLVWEFYHYRREVASKCRPNPAHYAIAELERRKAAQGHKLVVLTQNVDRLHQAAGSKSVVELHGSIWDVCRATRGGYRCDSKPAWQDRRQPLVPVLAGRGAPDPGTRSADIPVEELPHDEEGHLLRPGVVWFQENLEDEVVDKTEDVLKACDMLVIVGTSAVVYPAAGYAPQVAMRGVPVAEFNLETTGNTGICTYQFQGKAGELLPAAFQVEAEVSALCTAAGEERS